MASVLATIATRVSLTQRAWSVINIGSSLSISSALAGLTGVASSQESSGTTLRSIPGQRSCVQRTPSSRMRQVWRWTTATLVLANTEEAWRDCAMAIHRSGLAQARLRIGACRLATAWLHEAWGFLQKFAGTRLPRKYLSCLYSQVIILNILGQSLLCFIFYFIRNFSFRFVYRFALIVLVW